MLSTGERPRELRWYHAGPMLFGDWGTSRLYVLGLAYAFTGRASFWFIAAMCGLMIGVGWSYEIICRLFPDGGGVYSSAKHRSQLLAVIGGLLLCADYVVTASMSCLDGFHYLEELLGIKDLTMLGLPIAAWLAAGTILAIGGINVFGPTKAGTVAMIVALATVALTLVIGVRAALHFTGVMPVTSLGQVHLASPFSRGIWNSWVGFTEIVLALSGVEAIANMTGIMVPPVERTARRAILPVLIEIVILNLILAAAMNALPDKILTERAADGTLAHTADMLKVIAKVYVHPVFATISAVVFAALLMSAVNTALADLVSIQFMLSRDRELPPIFAGLNRFGMPMLPLVVGSIFPALVVLLFPNVEALAGLYAIGVVGAISINLGTTSTNPELALKGWERTFMQGLTLIMIAIGATICVVKPHARGFALIVLVIGLAGRLATVVTNRAVPISRSTRIGYSTLAALAVLVVLGVGVFIGNTPTQVEDRLTGRRYPTDRLYVFLHRFPGVKGSSAPKEVWLAGPVEGDLAPGKGAAVKERRNEVLDTKAATAADESKGKTEPRLAPDLRAVVEEQRKEALDTKVAKAADESKRRAAPLATAFGPPEGEPIAIPYLSVPDADRHEVAAPSSLKPGTLVVPILPLPMIGLGLSVAAALAVGYASYRTQGYREALIAREHQLAEVPVPARPKMLLPGDYTAKERVMVATQGNPRLIQFALKECKSRQAELQLLFVRHLAVTPMGPAPVQTLAEDTQATELFDRLRVQAKEAGVPLRLIYGVARDVPDAILDMAVTHGADVVVLGSTRRGTLWKAMKGDVIQAVAEQLPETITLLIHA